MKLRIEVFGEDSKVPFYGYDCMSMTHPASAVQMGADMFNMYNGVSKVIIRDTDCGGWFKEVITKENKDKYFKYALSYDRHAVISENGVESVHTYPAVEKFKSLDMLYSRQNDLQMGGRIIYTEVRKYDNFVISEIGK